MLIPNRERLETLVRRATKRAMRPYRKADHNRQPPYAKIKKALIKELNPILNRIRRDAAKRLVKEFGKPGDKWLPEDTDRASRLADDLIEVSKRRWREMRKPRTREEVLKWRKQNLGDLRAVTISVTEVTMANQQGEEIAWAHLRTQGVLLEGYWRTKDPCPLCQAMKDKPSAFWRRFYPSGPPSPHVRCVCEIEHIDKMKETLGGISANL